MLFVVVVVLFSYICVNLLFIQRFESVGVWAQGAGACRVGDAGTDGLSHQVRQGAAAQGHAHFGLSPHDHSDRSAHRDSRASRSLRPMGLVQHLLHPGPRRRRHCQGLTQKKREER